MDAIECLKKRRSVRRFIEKDISKEVIEEIVESGALAATARNVQPIRFYRKPQIQVESFD